jgi:Tol biopolymer transport system component
MSPEQARGAAVDKRADIWAFGCVLYEMLTGKQAFHGETTSDILAAVLKEEPDWSRIPERVQPLLRRCLVKDPKHRLRDIGDALAIVENTPEAAPASSRRAWILAIVASVFGVFSTLLAIVHFREKPSEARGIATSIDPPENTSFDFAAAYSPPALSPDGRRIAFRARGADGKSQLWVRPLDSSAAQRLAGTEGASNPFWSPDSRSLAFFAEFKLKRMDAAGGPALSLPSATPVGGGSWSWRDVIVFKALSRPGLLEGVEASGGPPRPVTRLETSHEYAHQRPWFLPDGRHFLFEAQTHAWSNEMTLRIGALDSQEAKTIGAASSNAVYSSGYLLFLRENTLMAQPFDETRLTTTGEAAPLAEKVRRVVVAESSSVGIFTASQEGLLAYQVGGADSEQLTWLDRNGKSTGTMGDAGEFWSVEFSPDRKNVAVTRLGDNGIWVYEVARGLATRLTTGASPDRDPVWSPDGKSVIYYSNAKDKWDLYRKAADGTGNEELLYADEAVKVPSSWSPDGKFLLYWRSDPKLGNDIWALPLSAGAPSKPYPWLATPFSEIDGKFSPDGRWVAYASNESGRMEVYVAPFPGPGPKRQISSNGGSWPRWRADGKEVFYEVNGTLMAAEVAIQGASVEVGAVRSLGIPVSAPFYKYDVSADGQRFLVATPREQKSSAPLTLVQNWTALLKKK